MAGALLNSGWGQVSWPRPTARSHGCVQAQEPSTAPATPAGLAAAEALAPSRARRRRGLGGDRPRGGPARFPFLRRAVAARARGEAQPEPARLYRAPGAGA